MIGELVRESVNIVHQTEAGIHPAETEHHIHKIEKQMQKLKQVIHYISALQGEADSDTDSAIKIRLHRDKRSLWQMLNHLQACVAHLRGHDWGIFRK